MKDKNRIFIGVDLAWTENNETGICIIDASGKIIFLDSRVFDNNEIINLLTDKIKYSANISVGIDAPLIFPKNKDEYRIAEKELKKTKINNFHLSSFQVSKEYMNRVYNGSRGEKIAEKITDDNKFKYTEKLFKYNYEIIETFPTGINAGIFPEIFPVKYKLKGKISDAVTGYNILYEKLCYFENIDIIKNFTQNFLPLKKPISGKEYKHIEDKLDAFLCALGMYLTYKNACSSLYFGQLNKGLIFIPVIQTEMFK